MIRFTKSDWKFTAAIAFAVIVLVTLLAIDDNRAGKEQRAAEIANSLPVLLPLDGVDNIQVERITNELDETWLVFHTKRQLILDKEELNDCGGSNLPPSLKPFRQDLLSLNGVENVDIRAYEFVVQKGRLFAWEEVEGRVKELITTQYPCVAVADTTKEEN